MKRTCFIGAGNMAEALVRGLLASGRFGKKDMAVCDVNPERLSLFSSEYGIRGARTRGKPSGAPTSWSCASSPASSPRSAGR